MSKNWWDRNRERKEKERTRKIDARASNSSLDLEQWMSTVSFEKKVMSPTKSHSFFKWTFSLGFITDKPFANMNKAANLQFQEIQHYQCQNTITVNNLTIKICIDFWSNFVLKDRHQNSLLILSKFKKINWHLFPWNLQKSLGTIPNVSHFFCAFCCSTPIVVEYF